jgi:hypothetical protein
LYLNDIRQLAYQKWAAAGMPEGNSSRFWLEAEQELLQMTWGECEERRDNTYE